MNISAIGVLALSLGKISKEIRFDTQNNLHFQILTRIVRRTKTKYVKYKNSYFYIFLLCEEIEF